MAQTANTSTEVGHAGGEAHSAGFPPFDPTFYASQVLWLALTFGVFYWLLSTRIVPRISSILEARSSKIARDIDEAARLKSETDAAIAGYEKELASARAKAQALATETRAALTASLDAKRHSAEAGLSTKLSEAEVRIADIKTKAMAEVGTIATDTAEEIVAALVKSSADRKDVAAAVNAVLAK